MEHGLKLSAQGVILIAKLINYFSIAGGQIMQMDQPNIWHQVCANLRESQKENKQFLNELDQIAQALKEEQITSLIDTLDRSPKDAAGMLSLSRRCLNTSAFLSHCLATAQINLEPPRVSDNPSSSTSIH